MGGGRIDAPAEVNTDTPSAPTVLLQEQFSFSVDRVDVNLVVTLLACIHQAITLPSLRDSC